jgi:hypothetical protein
VACSPTRGWRQLPIARTTRGCSGIHAALVAGQAGLVAELGCDVVAAWAVRDGPLERSLLRAGLQRPWARGVHRGARPSIAE